MSNPQRQGGPFLQARAAVSENVPLALLTYRYVAVLTDERLDDLLEAAADEDLWREAVALAAQLGDEQRRRIVAAVERMPDARVRQLADALRADPELLRAAAPLVEAAPPRLLALLDPASER